MTEEVFTVLLIDQDAPEDTSVSVHADLDSALGACREEFESFCELGRHENLPEWAERSLEEAREVMKKAGQFFYYTLDHKSLIFTLQIGRQPIIASAGAA